MNKRIQTLFFLSVFLTVLAWIFITPIWHFPDEQAHFGQVAFMAQKWRRPQGAEKDLTEEIYLSEKNLSIRRLPVIRPFITWEELWFIKFTGKPISSPGSLWSDFFPPVFYF